ncbi:PEP/pyruvate-binding domain-containing protein [Hymenobacter sp.]|uniref:PEP/pyruvate-binding domain-containing protein n=1 Tax=Hymenobacter sp. TaxID=1898978 RepID=UPI00286ABCAC|nr:PEP/pyruvate-binding domain-containing protein [Hymenobacter sp.]
MSTAPVSLLIGSRPSAPPAGHTVGGKAAGLYQLRKLGLAVPEFVVIPAEVFDPLLAGLGTDAAGLDARRAALLAGALPAAIQAGLAGVLAEWDNAAVAVRSSVADEDGAHAAFPGLMDSVLGVRGRAAVLAAVARCAASAYSERALAYRRQRGLGLAARPAVVVQRQVAAAAAGVLFTTFPEFPEEMAVHAVWGLGEGLVGGALEPDEFYIDKQTRRETHRKIALKTQQVQPRPDAAPGLVPVPAARRAQACLSTKTLAELRQAGAFLEDLLGGPQDVEFVVDEDEQLWLVQTRPITQAIPKVVVYDNANIQESYCGVTTPLTFSFAQRAYATVYRQTMRTLGLPAATIAAHEPVLTQLLGLVRGRVYYNINNWYRGLRLLPAFRQNKADLERMMGLEAPVDFVQSHAKTLPERLRLLPRLALNLARLLLAFARLPRQVAAFQQRFEGEYQRFYRLPLADLTAPALLAERARLDTALLDRWTTPIVNDFRVMMANGTVARRLRRAGLADPDEFLSRYYAAANAELASARPAHAMQAIARRAQAEYPQLVPQLRQLPPDLPAQLRRMAPALHGAIEAYLAQYGDRSIGELKLETETMRTDELLFYKYLRNYFGEDSTDDSATVGSGAAGFAATVPTGAGSLHEAAAAELQTLLRGHSTFFARQVWGSLRQLQQALARREELRLDRTRLFGMYRSLYRALGQRLVESGALRAPLDVFYLTETEIAAAARETGAAIETGVAIKAEATSINPWPALVASRRAEFARYRTETVPGRVSLPSRAATAPLAADAAALAAGTLRGTGCYPGRVSGEVILIAEPGDSLAVAGRIVAASRTDPGWAALFPTCRGVLIERGSALSHSVILLRELGIPTIINIPNLCQRLRSGQPLTMDGASGEIISEADGVASDDRGPAQPAGQVASCAGE